MSRLKWADYGAGIWLSSLEGRLQRDEKKNIQNDMRISYHEVLAQAPRDTALRSSSSYFPLRPMNLPLLMQP